MAASRHRLRRGRAVVLLLARESGATGVGVELQPRLAALAARGATRTAGRAPGDPGRATCAPSAIGWARPASTWSRPTRRTDAGGSRRPPDDERALAHQEIALALPSGSRSRRAPSVPAGGRRRSSRDAAADLLAELHASRI
jgi:hypothetical protein